MEGETQTERQNTAFVMRMQAEQQMKSAFFWQILTLIALLLGILWLAVIFVALATIMLISSIALEHRADKLWPNPKDWQDE